MAGDSHMPRPMWSGFRAALGVPAMGMFFALSGYGAMTHAMGIDLPVLIASVALIWSMPALMTFSEMAVSEAGLGVLFAAVAFANLRNIPMVITALAALRTRPGLGWSDVALAQLLSPTTWVHIIAFGGEIPKAARRGYFMAFSMTALSAALLGAVTGYTFVDTLPTALQVGMLILTPIFLLLIMASVRRLSGYASLALGAISLPVLMSWSVEWGLVLGGLGAGTAGFFLGGAYQRKKGG